MNWQNVAIISNNDDFTETMVHEFKSKHKFTTCVYSSINAYINSKETYFLTVMPDTFDKQVLTHLLQTLETGEYTSLFALVHYPLVHKQLGQEHFFIQQGYYNLFQVEHSLYIYTSLAPKFIMLKVKKNTLIKIFLKDIVIVKKENRNIVIETMDERYVTGRYTLQMIQEIFSDAFIAINKSVLINPEYIAGIAGNRLELDNRSVEYIARRKQNEVVDILSTSSFS